uniref:Uncharacterized protein n=1 Tax=Bionectria ochroleuca TaxID=29856 RepID=A0A0B7JS56_BIOOC
MPTTQVGGFVFYARMLVLFFLPSDELRRSFKLSLPSECSPLVSLLPKCELSPFSLWKKLKLRLAIDLLPRLDLSRRPNGLEVPLSLFFAFSSFANFLLSSSAFCSSSLSLLRACCRFLMRSSCRFFSSSFACFSRSFSANFSALSACFSAFSAASRSFFSRFLSSFDLTTSVGSEVELIVVTGTSGIGGLARIGIGGDDRACSGDVFVRASLPSSS